MSSATVRRKNNPVVRVARRVLDDDMRTRTRSFDDTAGTPEDISCTHRVDSQTGPKLYTHDLTVVADGMGMDGHADPCDMSTPKADSESESFVFAVDSPDDISNTAVGHRARSVASSHVSGTLAIGQWTRRAPFVPNMFANAPGSDVATEVATGNGIAPLNARILEQLRELGESWASNDATRRRITSVYLEKLARLSTLRPCLLFLDPGFLLHRLAVKCPHHPFIPESRLHPRRQATHWHSIVVPHPSRPSTMCDGGGMQELTKILATIHPLLQVICKLFGREGSPLTELPEESDPDETRNKPTLPGQVLEEGQMRLLKNCRVTTRPSTPRNRQRLALRTASERTVKHQVTPYKSPAENKSRVESMVTRRRGKQSGANRPVPMIK